MARSNSRVGLVCVLLVAAFDLSTIRDGHDWGDDFSQYIRHASNLASGVPYADTSYLYNPDNPSIGPRLYPPGFPVVLAPVVAAFGLALRPMKIEIVLFFAAALLLIHRLIQPLMPPVAAAAVVLLVGLNPFLWDFKDNVLSDIPFLFFFVATLLALTCADEREARPRRRIAYAVLGGATMYAAYATRVVGIVLLPSLLMRDLVRYRWVTKESAISATVFVVLAGMQYGLGPRDSSYTDLLTITPAIVAANVAAYLRWLADIFENGYADLPRKGLFVFSAGLAIAGYVSLWKQPRALLLAITPICYLAVIIAWPLAQGTRFLIPVIPIYLACCVLGASSIDAMAERWGRPRLALGALIVAVSVTYIARYTTLPMTRVPDGIAKRESVELFDFVRTSTHRDDVIVFSRPRALALFTGRTVTPPPRSADPCRLWSYMQRVRATHLVTGPGAANEEAASLARFARDYADDLHELMHNADVAVYRVDRAPTACAPHD